MILTANRIKRSSRQDPRTDSDAPLAISKFKYKTTNIQNQSFLFPQKRCDAHMCVLPKTRGPLRFPAFGGRWFCPSARIRLTLSLQHRAAVEACIKVAIERAVRAHQLCIAHRANVGSQCRSGSYRGSCGSSQRSSLSRHLPPLLAQLLRRAPCLISSRSDGQPECFLQIIPLFLRGGRLR